MTSFDQSTAVCANASATAQDSAAVNDCCRVGLVAERDARIAYRCHVTTSVSVSRALTKCSVRDVVVPSSIYHGINMILRLY